MSNMAAPTLLYVTDLSYESKGRRYHEEDLFLSDQLRRHFDLVLCHPRSAATFVGHTDGILFRNAGPVLLYQDAYRRFRERARASGARVYNTLTGKGDMSGKQYLVDLSREGYPVIPTVDDVTDLARLPHAEDYVVKPKLGADSIGMRIVGGDELAAAVGEDDIVQPQIDFLYEVSFYFVDRQFQYALYAPDPAARWELELFTPTDEDLLFARRFIEWNDLDRGIQRVDACRTAPDHLLLMELEDINPYLSLDVLDVDTRARFVETLTASLTEYLVGREGAAPTVSSRGRAAPPG